MAQPRAFRFGVLGESLGSREDLVEIAREAEDAGYATLHIRDHFIAEPFGHQLAPLTALATAAAVTETLRVGTLVLDNDYRHPVLLAKEVATLDLLSNGRVELGIGAGWLRAEYDHAGIRFERAGTRIDRFAEALHIIKGLFADAPLTFEGQHYTVANLDSFPKPVQRPRPPILVGGGGKRMLSLAAREANIISILSSSVASGELSQDPNERLPENVAQKIAWIREAAGDRFSEIELSTVVSVVVAENYRQVAESFARERGWKGVTVDQVLEMPSVLIGSVDRIVDVLQERRERYGFTYFVVSDRDAAAFAPIVANLAGS